MNLCFSAGKKVTEPNSRRVKCQQTAGKVCAELCDTGRVGSSEVLSIQVEHYWIGTSGP